MMQVIAVDEEKPTFISTATVTINIKDDNDNSPLFANDTYELTVPEHSAVGTILANITVSPAPSGFLLSVSLHVKKSSTQSFFFPRLMILTRWMKAKSPTDFSQTACMQNNYSAYLNAATVHL